MKHAPSVAVIGAGIVGASVAYHFARRGVSVTLIDKGQPARECTGASFAWIGPDPGTPLGSQTLEEYQRLERELHPALPIKWSGATLWAPRPEQTERYVRERAAAGYDVRLVERDEVLRLEPNLREPPEVAAMLAGGSVEPLETTQLLVRAAQELGAHVLFDMEPARLVVAGNRVTGVTVAGEALHADIVVVATGTSTNLVTEPLGITLPIESSPAMLVKFRTPGPLVSRVIATTRREIRQISGDMMLSPETDVSDGAEVAERVLQQVRSMLTGSDKVTVESVSLGQRPIPVDGLPIVGYLPEVEGLYVTVMHAGVNLAPAIGRLATVEILDEVPVRLLDACRPLRFLARR